MIGEGVGALCSETIKGATQSLNVKFSQDVSLSNSVGRSECGLSDPAVGKNRNQQDHGGKNVGRGMFGYHKTRMMDNYFALVTLGLSSVL